MHVLAQDQPAAPVVRRLAALTFAAGALGMGMSFVFLASSDHRDVLAGAAGFVAGAILSAAGLFALAVLSRPVAAPLARPVDAAAMDVDRWLTHFARNRENRAEPDWNAPMTLASAVAEPL